jgi:hypothetical protein
MAKTATTATAHKEGPPKRTSIGHGRRKRGSFKTRNEKHYRGQGK